MSDQRGDLTVRIKMKPGVDLSDEERAASEVATRIIELIRLAASSHGSDLADDAVTFVVERDNKEQLR